MLSMVVSLHDLLFHSIIPTSKFPTQTLKIKPSSSHLHLFKFSPPNFPHHLPLLPTLIMSNSSEDKSSMDLVQPSDHLCYVKCNFCNTLLAVGIPCRRLLDTVTVKCGHCSNLSFLSTRPPLQGQCIDHPLGFQSQVGFSNDIRKGASTSSSSTSSSMPNESSSPNFVVKPPEKKHRLPSAYNRFMKEEIQRIKAANPEIPHREAFSAAAKNWARYIPNSSAGSVSGTHNNE